MTATERWTEELAAWAIPPDVLAQAPRDPYAFPGEVIRRTSVDPLQTPTGEVVLARLDPGERLLDVGVGAARIASAFAATHAVVGVEPRPGLAEEARARGVAVTEGRWPDVADAVGTAPVVLSTHVLYDVQDPAPFLAALHGAAERRVVIELTRLHPWVAVGPLYRAVHGIDRPSGPTADLLAGVVEEVLGIRPQQTRWTRPGRTYADVTAYLDHQRQMACTPDDHPRVGALDRLALDAVDVDGDGTVHLPDAPQTTLWWDTDRQP